ncbi:MAG: hypothetical protein ACR2MX_11785 [Cyclobacteriaceae bacterium]
MLKLLRTAYYQLKTIIPRWLQLWLRRRWVKVRLPKYRSEWPILESAGTKPPGWKGWPEGKQFAVVLTHDVEFQKGHDRCLELMKLEKARGFKSSFNFVPERYSVSPELRKDLEENGFEVGVHGLNHDGKLFQSKQIFTSRAEKINHYLAEWKAVGFRAPAMHRNLQWMLDLDVEYDLSTFDTDPFEPQPSGVGTIFPFMVTDMGKKRSYVELPYTLAQDFTPFILMRRRDIGFWTKKIDWIVKNGGMVLVNTHPDYMSFNATPGEEEFPIELYLNLLKYIEVQYADQYWHALPKDVAGFYKKGYA